MRERINRLAKGIIDNVTARLKIEPAQIEGNIRSGEKIRGELYIANEESLHIKGLVYSFNTRVKILSDTFGGIRNRIGYEVDGSYLSQGDKIAGTILLVTNGGEYEIPYCFQVDLGVSGQSLDGLKDKDDFRAIAKDDMEQALQLFEYQDFVNAPFMQDIHTRAVYDGIKGRGSRMNQLEEFLVALKLKWPVEIFVKNGTKIFVNPAATIEETIIIRRQTWGYVQIELQMDGDFIEVEKNLYTDQDFVGEECRIPYRIRPERLHYGKNLGSILISTIRGNDRIRFEVLREQTGREAAGQAKRVSLSTYIGLRLDYESGLYEDRLLHSQMVKELERLRREDDQNVLFTLLLAEVWLNQSEKARADDLLGSVKDTIMATRQEQPELYCFYQYIAYLRERKEGQREALTRLLRKFLQSSKRADYLFYMLLRVEPELSENPGDLLARMRHIYREGGNSPFLYLEAFILIDRNHELLQKIDSFELQVLTFAARRDMIEEPLAMRIAGLATTTKHYHRLFHRLLLDLYEVYPVKALLEAICALLIKGDIRSSREFPWYEKALQEEINLTRLYEYYLYSLPRDYDRLLPREVLLYFSYVKELDSHSRSVLYLNIIQHMNPDDALYKLYERDMDQFATEQLFESRINSRLAGIYEHFIYKELIDVPVAMVLPAVLRSFRVRCKNPRMKYVVVSHEEIVGEEAYPLKDGVAYVPLYSEHNIVLFQDAYGNRYADVPHVKSAIMKRDIAELEERCFDVYPNHPMLRLQECIEILDAGIGSDAELETLAGILADLPLQVRYKQRLITGMIDYILKKVEEAGEDYTFDNSLLKGIRLSDLSDKEHARICEILILQGRIHEAYAMICQYGTEGIRSSRLMKLCTKMILKNLFNQDDLLLRMSYEVFLKGRYDSVILDYLCEHFNGKSDQMYRLLEKAIEEHVETYDLEERVLAQMLFAGEYKYLDQAFDLYITRKKAGENLVRAYFTVKSAAFFLEDKETSDTVFNYLENAVSGAVEKNRIPSIFLIALTKHYANKEELSEIQKQLCRVVVDMLLEEEMVFPYFKELGKHIPMPEEIMTSVMVEYRMSGKGQPEIETRTVPVETMFYREPMRKVFSGIYITLKRLFDGETLEYRIYEKGDPEEVCREEGQIAWDLSNLNGGSRRYQIINQMSVDLRNKEESALKETMIDYAAKAEAVEHLFDLV